MTNEEVRDELARLAGWEFCSALGNHWWRRVADGGDHEDSDDHPMPPTLDGANAAVPYGYLWGRVWAKSADGLQERKWIARTWTQCPDVEVPDHGCGHEMEDLYALALACVRAEEKAVAK